MPAAGSAVTRSNPQYFQKNGTIFHKVVGVAAVTALLRKVDRDRFKGTPPQGGRSAPVTKNRYWIRWGVPDLNSSSTTTPLPNAPIYIGGVPGRWGVPTPQGR